MKDYKNVPLERENIDNFVNQFAEENNLEIRSNAPINNHKIQRVILGCVGIDDCKVDLYLVNDGSTTIQWKIGQNQELGIKLADYLLNTINSGQLDSVNFSLKGITSDEISPIIDELSQCLDDENNNEFNIETKSDDIVKKVSKITSIKHDDHIVIAHYKTTNKLLIQGKPLFTYRKVIYLLSELLDLNGLQSVLSCTDENTVSIVRKEVAEDYLKNKLPNSYEQLPHLIKTFMCAGCCVKLASPTLPEYSMLLFPDLRALEGVLRTVLSEYGLHVGEQKHGFGTFFTVYAENATLKEEFKEIIAKPALIVSMERAYTFFIKHRHSLFHMEDLVNASRKIDTLDKVLSLSGDTYIAIDNIYATR